MPIKVKVISYIVYIYSTSLKMLVVKHLRLLNEVCADSVHCNLLGLPLRSEVNSAAIVPFLIVSIVSDASSVENPRNLCSSLTVEGSFTLYESICMPRWLIV